MRKALYFIVSLCTALGLGVTALAANFNNDLVDQADAGHLNSVISLLHEGHHANSQGDFGVTALMRAAFNGDSEMVNTLLHAGADPNIQDLGGATALHLAARNGHHHVVTSLIDKGAKPDVIDDEKWTPLMRAIVAGRAEAANILVAKGANVARSNADEESILELAAASDNLEMIALLKPQFSSLPHSHIQKARAIADKRNNTAIIAMLQEVPSAPQRQLPPSPAPHRSVEPAPIKKPSHLQRTPTPSLVPKMRDGRYHGLDNTENKSLEKDEHSAPPRKLPPAKPVIPPRTKPLDITSPSNQRSEYQGLDRNRSHDALPPSHLAYKNSRASRMPGVPSERATRGEKRLHTPPSNYLQRPSDEQEAIRPMPSLPTELYQPRNNNLPSGLPPRQDKRSDSTPKKTTPSIAKHENKAQAFSSIEQLDFDDSISKEEKTKQAATQIAEKKTTALPPLPSLIEKEEEEKTERKAEKTQKEEPHAPIEEQLEDILPEGIHAGMIPKRTILRYHENNTVPEGVSFSWLKEEIPNAAYDRRVKPYRAPNTKTYASYPPSGTPITTPTTQEATAVEIQTTASYTEDQEETVPAQQISAAPHTQTSDKMPSIFNGKAEFATMGNSQIIPASGTKQITTGQEYLLQLGTFASEDQALYVWKNLSAKHADVLSQLKPKVKSAYLASEKTTLYRLRAGNIDDKLRAKQSCANLKNRNIECFVVEQASQNMRYARAPISRPVSAPAVVTPSNQNTTRTTTEAKPHLATPPKRAIAQNILSQERPINSINKPNILANTSHQTAPARQVANTRPHRTGRYTGAPTYRAVAEPQPAPRKTVAPLPARTETTPQQPARPQLIANAEKPHAIPPKPAPQKIAAPVPVTRIPMPAPKATAPSVAAAPVQQQPVPQRHVMPAPHPVAHTTPVQPTMAPSYYTAAAPTPAPAIAAQPPAAAPQARLPQQAYYAPVQPHLTAATPAHQQFYARMHSPEMQQRTQQLPVAEAIPVDYHYYAQPAAPAPNYEPARFIPALNQVNDPNWLKIINFNSPEHAQDYWQRMFQFNGSYTHLQMKINRENNQATQNTSIFIGPVTDQQMKNDICQMVEHNGYRCQSTPTAQPQQHQQAYAPAQQQQPGYYHYPTPQQQQPYTIATPLQQQEQHRPANQITTAHGNIRYQRNYLEGSSSNLNDKSAWINLGTFNSTSEAEFYWHNTHQNHTDILANLKMSTPKAKRHEYFSANAVELKIGPFKNEEAAHQVCDLLRYRQVTCVVQPNDTLDRISSL